MAQKHYSPIHAPSLSMSELVCKTLDCDATDLLIDKWLEHRNDAYWDWFQRVRERKHVANAAKKGQVLLWSKGAFVPENIFCRTVDTGRLIPLDRTWTTHVYHHKSMQERRFSMMPVVFTMVRSCFFLISLLSTPLRYGRLQLPELMLLRGMHDHRCDDIFIIVTDLKRQEMDDVTEYFKLVCKNTFGRTLKPSMEQKLLYERQSSRHTPDFQSFNWFPPISRHAPDSCAGSPPEASLFPSDRPHVPRHLTRTHASLHHPFFPPNHIVFPDLLHAPRIRSRGRNLLRFPERLSQSIMHGGL